MEKDTQNLAHKARKKTLESLKEYQLTGHQVGHLTPDGAICYFLEEIGYADIAKEWEKAKLKDKPSA